MASIKNQAPVLYKLARFITSYKAQELSYKTVHQTKRVIADTIGTAYSGIKSGAFIAGVKSLESGFSKGKCRIWGTNLQLDKLGATFLNALAVSSTDFDEGHRSAVGHPAGSVVPVAFALGEENNIQYEKVIASIAIGYETGTRFSNARFKEKVTTWSSGRWGALGAAATASFLLQLDTEQTLQALSLAAVLSPVMLGGSTDVNTGSMAKEGVAWAAFTGLQCALLAKNGFSGPYLFIDAHDDYDKNKLTGNLGKSLFIDSNYFKPYACCRWLHSAIDAGIKLKKENNFKIDEIESIEIEVFSRIKDLVNIQHPVNTIQAQFHLPYCFATAIQKENLLPEHFDRKYLEDNRTKSIINKIRLVKSERYNILFPEKLPSRASITLQNGKVISKEIITALWDASNQPADEELFKKFISQTGKKGVELWEKLFNPVEQQGIKKQFEGTLC